MRDVDQSWTDLGHFAWTRPTSAKFDRSWPGFCATWPRFDQSCASLVEGGQISAICWPASVSFGRIRPNSAGFRPTLARALPNLGDCCRVWLEFGQLRPWFDQTSRTLPNAGNELATFAQIWAISGDIVLVSAQLGPGSSFLSRLWPKLTRFKSTSARKRPSYSEFDVFCPNQANLRHERVVEHQILQRLQRPQMSVQQYGRAVEVTIQRPDVMAPSAQALGHASCIVQPSSRCIGYRYGVTTCEPALLRACSACACMWCGLHWRPAVRTRCQNVDPSPGRCGFMSMAPDKRQPFGQWGALSEACRGCFRLRSRGAASRRAGVARAVPLGSSPMWLILPLPSKPPPMYVFWPHA